MKTHKALQALSALAQESRLAVYILLLDEPEGLAAGEIAERMEVPATTMSFHLSQLKNAGLITSMKNGKSVVYSANLKKAKKLGKYITGKKSKKEKKYQL